MGGPTLQAECTFCDRPTPAVAILHDRITGLVTPACPRHETTLTKLVGFADPKRPSPPPEGLFE